MHIAEAREIGPRDFAVRSRDHNIGEISRLGIRDGTGVELLKYGVSEALLNRVLCQALQKRWVLKHDVLRVVSHVVSPGGLSHYDTFRSSGTTSREASIGRQANQASHDARWRCETIEARQGLPSASAVRPLVNDLIEECAAFPSGAVSCPAQGQSSTCRLRIRVRCFRVADYSPGAVGPL